MNSSSKFNSFFALIFVPLVFFLSSCSERSEFGEASDYEKLGYDKLISSVFPTDNSTSVSVSTKVAITFLSGMSTGSITTNTSDTTCSGSFQLSSDNFSTCIQMSTSPSASNNNKSFTITPASSLSGSTTYKLRLTTSVTDTSSNSLAYIYTTNGFTTSEAGTINGGVISQSDSSALSGVNVSFAPSGTTVATTTTDSSGDFSQYLSLGTYTLTYIKYGYLSEIQCSTLATDNQTLVITTLSQLPNTCQSTGTISGKITDAVSSANVSGVSLSVTSGLNCTSGTVVKTATNLDNGTYSLSDMSAGWYTVSTSKSGYIDSTFHVYSCGNVSSQDSSISTTLASGAMRIVLSWPTGSTATDIDSHLQIPDNDSNAFHIYYGTNTSGTDDYYQYGASDNVTLDRDERTAPGTETITITTVKSGTYSYSAHDYTNRAETSIRKLGRSRASVTIYYNALSNNPTVYNVQKGGGNLWTVFTFTTSGGLTEVGTMSYQATASNIY